MIERKIIIGLIVSTEYMRSIRNVWDLQLIESATAKKIASWAWEYFEKYDKAPGRNIESIFYEKVKTTKLTKEIAIQIEEDILPGLSEEYSNESINVEYLINQTKTHFRERKLQLHSDSIQAMLASNQLDDAENTALGYKPIPEGSSTDLDLGHDVVLERIEKAFSNEENSLIYFPKQLGEFWNDQFYRGSFIAFLASEKKGKTWMLMQIGLTAHRQGKNVAFFQAGDMSETQQLVRIAVNLAGKSNIPKYSGVMYEPIRDCIYNQLGTCDKKVRECDFGVFEGYSEEILRTEMLITELIEAHKNNPNYVNCHNCTEYHHKPWGVPWVKPVDTGEPLEAKEAMKVYGDFFLKNKRSFKLSTHANGALSVKQMRSILGVWEKEDNFVPDVIIVDYADLLTTDTRVEFRHQQNQIWKDLRGLGQEKCVCLLTATQADADSYSKNLLTLKNFSEDKRKFGHVTAMYGLNQDPNGREKKLGIMRINEIIKREGEFSNNTFVTVLQNIRRGRPIISSYF